MNYLKLSFLCTSFLAAMTIYDISLPAIDGTTIDLDNYHGKKILFVNTATNSPYVNQYAGLEQLYQRYKDSLVIIACPSNSFGNEPGNDSSINQFVSSAYNIHYLLAKKTIVIGDSSQPLYKWLTQLDKNDVMENPVKTDFYKFLVDENGRLVGAFSGSTDPMSNRVQEAIQTPTEPQ